MTTTTFETMKRIIVKDYELEAQPGRGLAGARTMVAATGPRLGDKDA